MLRRKIDREFERWFSNGKKKALFVEGARQVGKTTTIRQFCNTHYDNFIEINFIKKPVARQAFDGNLDAETIVMNLSAMGYGPFEKDKTVIFLDEIQDCPNARTALKFLVEDGSYDYIESGSLLGINYKENDEEEGDIASLPVGYEDTITMFPLDFEEFLWASGVTEAVIDTLRKSFNTLSPVPDFIHNQIMQYFRQYLVVGGLPEIVDTFVNNSDFQRTVKAQHDLLAGYRRDITKYAKKDKALVRAVFDLLPFQLAKEDKRFVLAAIEEGAARRKYSDPTQWLIDAGMAYYAFHVNALSLPFANNVNAKLFKLYSLDTGLVCYMTLAGRQFEVMNGQIDINEGALAEEFVAAEFAKKGYNLYYYDKKSKHELDFLLADADGVHLGQSDMNPKKARDILGPDKIIGVTAKTVEQATLAQQEGANYLGSGAVFVTGTKLDAVPLDHNKLDAICESVSIPVVAIGGIDADNILQLMGRKMSGFAVVNGIFGQKDIKSAAKELKQLAMECLQG